MGLTSKSALYSEGPSCQVHPQVLFSIVDHFSRREGGQNRVIGTLLGTVGADGVVEVDSCFPVPHTETEEQVAVNTDFHATMLQLHQRVHPKQKVVGWYSTGEEVNDSSILFHDFYGQGVERPVHLLLDLGLGETRMSCKAYVSTQLKLGATVLGTSFSDIKCTVVSAESDRIGMEALMKTANSGGQLAGSTAASPMAEVDSMELTVKKLLRTLDAVIAHVESDDSAWHATRSFARVSMSARRFVSTSSGSAKTSFGGWRAMRSNMSRKMRGTMPALSPSEREGS